MPEINRDVTIAVDMHGCPNQCRHCWLGPPAKGTLSTDDLRWIVNQFRSYTCEGETEPFIENLTVSSWIWEPDFSDQYKELYNLEKELSDKNPHRFELLSVWRLARDKEYTRWAKDIGPDTCQITFFGMEETTDWFYRRKGAFKDCIKATEQLLDVGMKPRWQFFLTKKMIPELTDLLSLVDKIELRERVKSLGGQFEMFMHTPSPDGEARKIEYLRPTLKDTESIPEEIVKASQTHFGTDRIWYTEGELVTQIMEEEDSYPYPYCYPDIFGFYITRTWDVFSNIGTLEPWWLLGNLKTDSVHTLFDRFEHNYPLGFKTMVNVSPKGLAKEFGNPQSTHIYTDKNDLKALYLAKYCETCYSADG